MSKKKHGFVRRSEDVFFNHRPIYIALIFLCTLFLGWKALFVTLDSSLEKMVPMAHPYIENLFEHKDELSLGNDLRIAVERVDGDIFNADYLEVLKKITDEVFYLDGVNKSGVQSLWTSNVRWVEVTEDGFIGGEVIPPDYDGSAESLRQVQANVLRSGQVGRLVADNFKSSIVYVPLLDQAEDSPEKLDYQALSHALEQKIRRQFEGPEIRVHIVGFGKKIGDMIDGAAEVGGFFLIGVVLTFIFLLLDVRCLRSAIIIVGTSIVAVVWQMGILTLLGYGIDPYSMLVPFLIFAIAVSHSVQIVHSFADEKVDGYDNFMAGRLVFRSLFAPGAAALVGDAIGFFTLYIIDIRVIQELAVAAGIGTLIVTFTNLVLVKVIFSYVGISDKAIEHARERRRKPSIVWRRIAHFARPEIAWLSIGIAAVMLVAGLYEARELKTGDLDAGAPELRPDSRYNLDDAFITENYSVSADVLVVMVETPEQGCTRYPAMEAMDRFMWFMENVEGVQSTVSIVTVAKRYITGTNEGNLKWQELPAVEEVLNSSVQTVPEGLINTDCSLAPVIIFLSDHKAETLKRVTSAVEGFAHQNNDKAIASFVLASGNAGVEAATNDTISAAANTMMWFVYAIVILVCLMTFDWSVAGVTCIITPLVLTSILCEALMVHFGMGVKVATLPVIALGVGIGVDYGIYIFSKMCEYLDEGIELEEAYFRTLCLTGKAVAFTAFSLSVGVGTWIFSDIKFQADMGKLLTFMFAWNMVGALWLLPAIANVLLKFIVDKPSSSASS
ncbi:Conserved hypothetical protein [gamma proteobacterium HdN1]|nr:Conserved hypothetical protein [gamma proteobacterium HdN1]